MFGENKAATVKSQPVVGQSLLEKGKTLEQILQKENPEINKEGGGRSVVALGYMAAKAHGCEVHGVQRTLENGSSSWEDAQP